MTSIKVKFRPSNVAGSEGTIYYQIIHERKVRQLFSDYHVFTCEWNERRSMVAVAPELKSRRSLIHSVRESVRRDVGRLTRIVRRFESDGMDFTTDDVVDEFRRYAKDYTLRQFMERIIVKLKQTGKLRTSETYTATLRSFEKFLASQASQPGCRIDDNLMLDCLTSEIMERYEAWLESRGVTPNTISFYNRILRAVYNRAVESDVIENRNPFRHVYTGIEKTVKRALPLPMIKKIKSLDLSPNVILDYARDIFMLSFMFRGMSFVDMAYLKKSDRSNGFITYRRRKTGQQLIIKWTKEMQAILDKYPENKTDYLLPIIKNPATNERYAVRKANYNINHNLKKIAGMVGATIPLTLYVARHSWASAARAKGIPVSVISEGMGHDSETTTKIYLASLDTSVVDRANSVILKSL